MYANAFQRRLSRLQRECNVSAMPALLLSGACALLVFVLAINAVVGETGPAQVEAPIERAMPAAA